MRKTVEQLKAEVRAAYPTFHYFDSNGIIYVGRWNFSALNSANQLGSGCTLREGLEDAVRQIKREQPRKKHRSESRPRRSTNYA